MEQRRVSKGVLWMRTSRWVRTKRWGLVGGVNWSRGGGAMREWVLQDSIGSMGGREGNICWERGEGFSASCCSREMEELACGEEEEMDRKEESVCVAKVFDENWGARKEKRFQRDSTSERGTMGCPLPMCSNFFIRAA